MLCPPVLSRLGVLCALLLAAPAWAQPAAVRTPQTRAVALFRVEPLGLDAERATRLEALLRLELERLAGQPLPSRAQVERTVAASAPLRACAGEPECLAAIGQALGARLVVSGNVGELGESYVINLKLVDVGTRAEVRRISQPLHGAPDELIEAVRVAAYRLVAPDRLLGSLAILSDVPGATVVVDGRPRGVTPLARPLTDLTVGPHDVKITAPGYTPFASRAEVHFQKTTQIVVKMVVAADPAGDAIRAAARKRAPEPTPWYATGWGYAGIGVGAIALGVVGGLLLFEDQETRTCDLSCR